MALANKLTQKEKAPPRSNRNSMNTHSVFQIKNLLEKNTTLQEYPPLKRGPLKHAERNPTILQNSAIIFENFTKTWRGQRPFHHARIKSVF